MELALASLFPTIRSPILERLWRILLLFILFPPSATLRRYLSRTTPLVIVCSMRMVRKLFLPCPTTANWMSAMHGRSGRKSRNNPASWVMLPFGDGGGHAVKLACYISRGDNFDMMTTSKRPRVFDRFFFFFHVIYSYFLAFFFFNIHNHRA